MEGEEEMGCIFFFQAEDGIRDGHVTGVQTCALPIWPDGEERSVLPSASAAATLACQVSLPTSQSKLSTWSASRSGTSRGSAIFAKEMRREPETLVLLLDLGLREATKGGPSTVSHTQHWRWEC